MKQAVVLQILEAAQGIRAVHEPGAANRTEFFIKNPGNMKPRIVAQPKTYTDINAITVEVPGFKGGIDADIDIGVLVGKINQMMHQPFGRKRRRAAYSQDAGLVFTRQTLDGLGKLVKTIGQQRKGRFCVFGQPDRSRHAIEQWNAEKVLQLFDLLAYRCRGDKKLICCLRETQPSGCGFERLK